MFNSDIPLSQLDPEVWSAIQKERERQEDFVELIASENYVSPAILQLQGSVLTNKYAEGYPGKRYYGGCQYVDEIETLAIERAKQLFHCAYANVQPHSGSQANSVVYSALMQPGDTLLAMSLPQGGHLTHGSPVNFSGKLYRVAFYGLNTEEDIDYEAAEKLATQHRPKVILAGFSAFSGIVDWQRFREIANRVEAYLVVDMAHVAGLVACGLYPSPVPLADVTTSTTHKTLRGPRGGLILTNDAALTKKVNSALFPGTQGGPLMHVIAAKAHAFKEAMQADFVEYQKQVLKNAKVMVETMQQRGYRIVSGGTHNHMFLVSLIDKNIMGLEAEKGLERAHITANKNLVPGDTRSPFITSGLRFGTPAITTRGFKEEESVLLATCICDVLDNIHDHQKITAIRERMVDLCRQFPVYGLSEVY